MICLGFSSSDPQFPLGPAPPGYFYPPLPYGPPLPPPFHYPHSNITTALRSSTSPVSPFLLPQSPPYSGPVYSLPPPSGPPYLPLTPGHHLPPHHLPQHPISHSPHPPPPLSPLAVPRPPLSPLVTKGKRFNDGKYVHDPAGDSYLPYVHDSRGDVALPYIHGGTEQ